MARTTAFRMGALCAIFVCCGKGSSDQSASKVPPAAGTHTLTVVVTGPGAVFSNPTGIDCGATCKASFAQGVTVTLALPPLPSGVSFAGWDGACAGQGACAVTMNADAAVGAHFVTVPPPPGQTFMLRVVTHGSGSVKSTPAGIDCGQTCSAPFAAGTKVALAATPAPGFKLTGWIGACSGSGDCSVTLGGDQSVEATFEAAPPPADECAGMTPSSLPGSVVATLPQNSCLGGTSDDGIGNFALGYTAGMGPVYPNYLFFTVQEGKAQRIGDTIPGGDESGTYVSSQPSGFSSFHVSGMTGGSNFSSYSHEGVRGSTTAVAEGNFADSPWSQVGIDPSGGTALVRTQRDGSGAWTTAYQRLDKTGAAETGWVTIDTGRHPVGAVGVALSGHVLVLESLGNPNWQARWLARDGTPLTGWFEGITGNSYPSIQFLVDGSLVVRFRTGSYPSGPAPWKFRVEDGKTVVSALPGWLAQRAAQNFYVVRGGRGYATWGSEGQCAGLEVVATSGKSCGCVAVADLGDLSSVGRDGSLIVPEPPANRGTCAYDLYLQLLK